MIKWRTQSIVQESRAFTIDDDDCNWLDIDWCTRSIVVL